jgi:ABC-2 type transport system ATP-binding protein
LDHGRILAHGTPAALKQSVGADTVVTVKASGNTGQPAELPVDHDATVTVPIMNGGQ